MYYPTNVALVLASASLGRADLLRVAGFVFEIDYIEIEECPLAGESVQTYVARLALDKARAVRDRHPASVVLGADTVVVSDGRILGKPTGQKDAVRILRQLAGRTHDVLTGVALCRGMEERVFVETTLVQMAPLSQKEIESYVASGEPFEKAGGYAIQGLASRFVERIEGSYTNVVGLPLAQVARVLSDFAVGHPPAARNDTSSSP